MNKFLAKLSSPGSQHKFIEYVPATDEEPEHLIAHINSTTPWGPVETHTALNERGDDIELATNVGQLPNTPLGSATSERLNHRVDGKFVAFEAEKPDKIDLVYTSRKPGDWLDEPRLHTELQEHAKVKALIQPVLNRVSNLGQLAQNLDYPTIASVAQDVVDSDLDIQHRLNRRLGSSTFSTRS